MQCRTIVRDLTVIFFFFFGILYRRSRNRVLMVLYCNNLLMGSGKSQVKKEQ